MSNINKNDLKNTFSIKEINDKISYYLKNNILIIFIAYFISTIAILFRNYMSGLPFSSINIIQSFLILMYTVLFFVFFLFVHFLFYNIHIHIKEKGNITLCFFLFILLVLICFLLYYLFNIFEVPSDHSLIIIFGYYYLFSFVFRRIKTSSFLVFPGILLFLFSIFFSIYVPVQLGGIRWQTVHYCDYANNECFEYEYFGVSNGLYQFRDCSRILLIPVEKGYIFYDYNKVIKKDEMEKICRNKK